MDYQCIDTVLIGNTTRAAEVKHAHESGNAYGDFMVAVKNRRRETTFFPVRCFGKLAEGVTGIRKGTKVFVAGELEISNFTGEDGTKRMTFRVLADTYRILAGGRRTEDGEASEEK